jgi:adenylate cyclase class 2
METEVKLYLPDLEAVRITIERAGASLTAPRVLERNWRYDTPNRTLSRSEQVIRLRQDSRSRLTYKGKGYSEGGIISRPEYEVEVSDFDAMAQILHSLGYEPYMLYEKYRTTYHLDEAEIVLDELPFGNFVEIEAEADHIERLIKTFAWQSAPRLNASYSRLFEIVKSHLGLTFDNLTFANFVGLTVTPDLFSA